jgi:PKD repeat protein
VGLSGGKGNFFTSIWKVILFFSAIHRRLQQIFGNFVLPPLSIPANHGFMKLWFYLFPISLFAGTALFSQDTLGGIINSYVPVTAIESCEAKLTTGSGTASFSPGDRVLLLQMGGATIDVSNSASFGNILNLGSAGLFEQNEVLGVSGPDVYLKYTLANDYDVAGMVQLVSFPLFENAIVTSPVTVLPLQNGFGGVVAFEVENTLTLDGDISADFAGFANQDEVIVTSNCTFLTNANNYHYAASDWRGAPKGRGIAGILPGKEHGRGTQANGGGGGNDHNSGGGGGGQLTGGGMGGKHIPPSALGCRGNYPGLGGKPLPDFPNRIYPGGSGGNGHVDDTGAGTPGGAGGGIVLILTNALLANDHTISAQGESPATAAGDGGGGGGGGGTILLLANQLTGTLQLAAGGGKGSDVQNPAERCFGPGGGGGGGRVLTNLGGIADISVAGGVSGKNLTPSPQCDTPASEATAGGDGVTAPFSEIPFSGEQVIPPAIVSQPEPVTACEGGSTVFEITTAGNDLNFQWQLNDGTGWQDVPNGPAFSGVQTPVLSISGVTAGFSGLAFRCSVTGLCTAGLISSTAELTVLVSPQAEFVITPLGGLDFSFENTSVAATGWLWDFGDNTTSTDFSPEHSFDTDGVYTVTLTVYNDCDTQSIAQMLSAGDSPLAAFSSNVQVGCAPLEVQFQNQSSGTGLSSFDWQFPGGTPGQSSEMNPIVTYPEPGSYDVTLTVANFLGEDTTSLQNFITVQPAPSAAFSFSANELTVIFTNNSIGGASWFWEFGDGATSELQNPTHVYAVEGTYSVTLTVTNADCGSALAQDVTVQTTGTDEAAIFEGLTIFPNPVRRELTIALPHPFPNEMEAILTTVNGRFVKSQRIHTTAAQFGMKELPAGMYLLEIRMGSQSARFKVAKLP